MYIGGRSFLPFISTCTILFLVIQECSAENHTYECIRRAAYSSCEVFNNCCEFRCHRSEKKRSTCALHGGYIETRNAECYCSSIPQAPQPINQNKRFSKLDLIAGILLIFVVDLLLFSFTF